MKAVTDEKLIKRNGQIGQWSSLAGLVVLAGGMFITWKFPELFNYALVALLLGFILTQVSIYMGTRFGGTPRLDEQLDTGLKGLPGEFTIYHFTTPAAHLLVGPAGIWVLLPQRQSGKVTYRNHRWKLDGGGFLGGYMRIFGQGGLGRPDTEADAEIKSVRERLAKHMELDEVPPISAALVFTAEDIEIDAPDAPMPALHPKELKEFMRRGTRERVLSPEQISKVNAALTED